MKHREHKSVQISKGIYSSTIFELEVWSQQKKYEYTEDEYLQQLKDECKMDCKVQMESVGLFYTKKDALDRLEMMHEDPFDSDKELSFAFIRERALHCMMRPSDYLKEWTYKNCLLNDESIVRNYDEEENPFTGRPREMVRFKKGDIVIVPDDSKKYCGHWGIVWGTPVTKEYIKEVNEKIEKETGVPGNKYSRMEWDDDNYLILTNEKGFDGGHEHIIAHHVIPALRVPDFVRKTLEKGLQKA